MKTRKFGIIIDTEQYSGNFERELCAFLTGKIGECGVGQEYAHENPLFDNVIDLPDERDCRRPCEICPTPGWFNHGLGGHFRNGEEAEALISYREAVKKWQTDSIITPAKRNLAALKAGKEVQGWSIEACNRELQRAKATIAEAKKLKKVTKHPAYLSVLVHMDSPPTPEQIAHIKKKAPQFAKSYRNRRSYLKDFKLTITGYRILETKTRIARV